MITQKKAEGFINEQLLVVPEAFLTNFLRNSLSGFLTVTSTGYFPHAKGHYIKRAGGYGAALLLYCSSGSGFYSILGEEHRTLKPGEAIILPPHVPHEYGASEDNPWTIYWVHLKGSCFQSYYDMIDPLWPVPIGDVMGDKLKELFHQCFCVLQMPYCLEEYLYLCQLVTTMLSLILCAAKQSSVQLTLNGTEGIERVITYMQSHLHEEISGAQLAAAARFSYSHLSSLFKKSTGYAPKEYFLHTKIQASARDLYFSSLSVKDIALSYGIEDAYYFSRLFKKIMGLSPSEYRTIDKQD
ncbi:MAG: AraC family transcriptional regulator [Treponema sp.]|jgi:AraC-like DNA-binding protein|nr:AraC family transcriptional regulator [Treponema sp.]